MGDALRGRAAHLVAATALVYACGGGDDTSSTAATAANTGGVGGATAGAAGAAGKGGAAGKVGNGGAGTSGGAGAAGTAGAPAGAAGAAGVGGTSAGAAGTSAGAAGTSGGAAGAADAGCGKAKICGPTSCGNGIVDTCMICGDPFGGLGGGPPPPPPPQGPGGGGGQCTTVAEGCDGGDFAGATCASLGYSGGAVTCTSTCEIDASACDPCAAGLPACGAAAFVGTTKVVDVAVASDGIDASLAWLDAAGAHFAKLDASLGAVNLSGAFGAPSATNVALTTLGNGDALVAVGGAGKVTLFQLNNGAATMVHAVTGSYPVLAARAAGPLLVYVDASGTLRSEVLGPTGTPGTPAKSVFMAAEAEYANAVFDGVHFLLAERGPNGATIVPIETSGAVGAPVSPGGQQTEYPQVASDGGVTRLTYGNFGNPPASGVYITSIDGAGQPTSQPTALGVLPAQFNVAPIVQRGATSVVLLGGYTGGTGIGKTLDVATFDATGLGSSTAVARAPSLHHYGIAKRTSDVVVAWLTKTDCSNKLWLARVAQ